MSTGMFILHSNYTPAGDQPEAIARLLSDIRRCDAPDAERYHRLR